MSEFIDRCRGSSAALPTPYSLGKVDFDALEAFCNRLIDRGISALVPCGTRTPKELATPSADSDASAFCFRGPGRDAAGGAGIAVA